MLPDLPVAESLEPEVVERRAEGHALTERRRVEQAVYKGAEPMKMAMDIEFNCSENLMKICECEHSTASRTNYWFNNAWNAAWQGSAAPTRTLRSQ